ncbi:glycine cleavage system protein GcvH [Rubrimonas cliftonensis]|uniref:Glycine cleavage system H protein n=1 Tax=Rubrimonas cliftonensis TaxID=89524 RepID=A0A1H4FJE2_9RHOB|nr:glycine cleavage system protein GcvH [Rubrimonas cliftonensis]SEA97473.1 glycine cleavage system H protein [Rubrimonas cliftonensis]
MTTYYTEDHEWLRVEGDVATVGVTVHAATQLGDVVFVEMKEPGAAVAKGDECGTVESVKAASEIYAPASGEIVEVNAGPVDNPASLNADPEGAAWLCRIRLSDPGELAGLMDRAAYDALTGA